MLATRLLRHPGRQITLGSRITAPPFPASPRKRSFHATAPRNDVLGTFLHLPHELVQVLHMGLPWYAALPLSAFIVRGIIVLTLGIKVRDYTSRYVALDPLRHATAIRVRDRLMNEGGFANPQEATKQIKKEVNKETNALNKRWACSRRGQILWTFAQFPAWLTMAETVRRMSGTHQGLLQTVTSSIGLSNKVEDRVYGSDEGLNPWYEPSLAEGGMLWFPDLLQADPVGALPYMASAFMFANIYFGKSTATAEVATGARQALNNAALGLTLLIGPLCQRMPASVMLYWCGSSLAVMLWNLWLERRYPLVSGFKACKRPALLPPPPPVLIGAKKAAVRSLASAAAATPKVVPSRPALSPLAPQKKNKASKKDTKR